jgi:hypothetical protein
MSETSHKLKKIKNLTHKLKKNDSNFFYKYFKMLILIMFLAVFKIEEMAACKKNV